MRKCLVSDHRTVPQLATLYRRLGRQMGTGLEAFMVPVAFVLITVPSNVKRGLSPIEIKILVRGEQSKAAVPPLSTRS